MQSEQNKPKKEKNTKIIEESKKRTDELFAFLVINAIKPFINFFTTGLDIVQGIRMHPPSQKLINENLVELFRTLKENIEKYINSLKPTELFIFTVFKSERKTISLEAISQIELAIYRLIDLIDARKYFLEEQEFYLELVDIKVKKIKEKINKITNEDHRKLLEEQLTNETNKVKYQIQEAITIQEMSKSYNRFAEIEKVAKSKLDLVKERINNLKKIYFIIAPAIDVNYLDKNYQEIIKNIQYLIKDYMGKRENVLKEIRLLSQTKEQDQQKLFQIEEQKVNSLEVEYQKTLENLKKAPLLEVLNEEKSSITFIIKRNEQEKLKKQIEKNKK